MATNKYYYIIAIVIRKFVGCNFKPDIMKLVEILLSLQGRWLALLRDWNNLISPGLLES